MILSILVNEIINVVGVIEFEKFILRDELLLLVYKLL